MSTFIHFLNGDDLDLQDHYLRKGYRNDVFVEIDRIFYEVYFFTKDSLEYEMRNDGFFSLPGIIILDEITKEKIFTAINYLLDIQFFKSFRGHTKDVLLTDNFSRRWYTEQTSKLTFENSRYYELPND